MHRGTALLILFVASVLEAGGDAFIRNGLKSSQTLTRAAWFVCGAAILFAYGYVVNAPPWDFGRLLGIYVVFFFLSAQIIAWLFFGQPPTRAVWIGGTLIVSGGLVMAFLELT